MTTAIICELNPLHTGHEYLISEAKKNGRVVLVMSGNFCQRGSSAVYNKYLRARAAVMCGADLVIELPFPWCAAGAADFARAGVHIANAVGADRLMFGSGSGNTDLLARAGALMAQGDFDTMFRDAERENPDMGAGALRQMLLCRLLGEDAATLTNPNDILGVEYFRYAELSGGLQCVPIPRRTDETASATELRHMMTDGDLSSAMPFIPTAAREIFTKSDFLPENRLYDAEQLYFRLADPNSENIAEASGGLGFRLIRAANEAESGEAMLAAAATKKFTAARLRRAALYMTCGITRADLREDPHFTTVLAIGREGREILRAASKRGDISIVTKPSDPPGGCVEQYGRSSAADRLYAALPQNRLPSGYFSAATPYTEK